MIDNSLYVVDERAVAQAIVARLTVRRLVAQPSFRSSRRRRRHHALG